jgi:hypothetical protein
MATVTQFWSDPGACYQADSTVTWTWAYGDRDFFWSFAVRPFQANQMVTVNWTSSVSDNDVNQVTLLNVTVAAAPPGPNTRPDTTGTLLRFTAIKVQEP